MVSIITVNIGAAALPRARRILAWLDARHEEVLVLTETSSGPGTTHILNHFRDQGCVVAANEFTGSERGVAIISRLETSSDVSRQFLEVSIPGRIAALRVEDKGVPFGIVGLYVPSRDQRVEKIVKKKLFLETLLRAIDSISTDALSRTIVCGDYNVIGRMHVPKYRQFLPFEYDFLDALQQRGFTDAFVHTNPGVHAYSWVGRTGDGYRYDYFHVGESLLKQVSSSSFHHDTRAAEGFTDHSALSLELL